MQNEDISAALELLDAASPGPARWTNPCTGKRIDGQLLHPVERFAAMLGFPDADAVRDVVAFDDDPATSTLECHGVSIPDPAHGSHTVADIEAGGEHLLVAITGNGPTSRANARAVAGMLDPVAGWRAALLEVRRLREQLAESERLCRNGVGLLDEMKGMCDRQAADVQVARNEVATAQLAITKLTEERDEAIRRQDRSLCLAELEGACSVIDEIAGSLKRERSTGRYEVLSGDGESSRTMSDAEVIRAVLEERDSFAARLAEKSREHEDLREDVFSAIEGGLGIITAVPGQTIRSAGASLNRRVTELRAELVRLHGVFRDMLANIGRTGTAHTGRTLAQHLAARELLIAAISTELQNLERPELRLTDWGDGITTDDPALVIATEAKPWWSARSGLDPCDGGHPQPECQSDRCRFKVSRVDDKGADRG